ncbi:hypothetical protein Vlu01_42690 [Micromonospora lutea]|uniref:Uncharacterized protein n=1 Tax=Micromonospora lutea TaxID=419825 RepID=A0ABQ4J0T1_9ACTN|nr:hypothetical protein Vlu01_42690 [Micromonospora lutea]
MPVLQWLQPNEVAVEDTNGVCHGEWHHLSIRGLPGAACSGPGHHPGHPTHEMEGCRPASRGFALALMTWNDPNKQHDRTAIPITGTSPPFLSPPGQSGDWSKHRNSGHRSPNRVGSTVDKVRHDNDLGALPPR